MITNKSGRDLVVFATIPGDPGVPESGALVRIELRAGTTYHPDFGGYDEVLLEIKPGINVTIEKKEEANHGEEGGSGAIH
jgi:hypothetical protein